MRKIGRLLLALAGLSLAHAAFAEGGAEVAAKPADDCTSLRKPGEHGKHLLWENDIWSAALGYGKSDRWYTNGMKVISTLPADEVPWWFTCKFHDVVGWWNNGEYDFQLGYTVGQLMFTPRNVTNPAPQPTDRFWGGWTYVGTVIQRRPKARPDELETLEIDFGVVGPLSGAEQVQKIIHGLSGSQAPAGWSNQLLTEPAVNFTYSRAMALGAFTIPDSWLRIDGSWYYGVSAGSLFDYANIGAIARFGTRLGDAPLGTIEIPALGGIGGLSNSWYVQARADLKASLHNTFIDGSLWRKPPHASLIDAKRFIPQLSIGIVGELGRGNRLSFLVNRRGAEFKSPTDGAHPLNFATLAYEWDL